MQSAANQLFRVSVTGHVQDIFELCSELKVYCEVEEDNSPKGVQDLKLDVSEVAAILALIPIVLTADPIAVVLRNWFLRRRRGRVRLESSLGIITIEPNRELTEEELRKLIRRLGGVL